MTIFSNTFGLAMRNFTAWPQLPDPRALIDYAERAEALDFDSVWVWDHILLGVDPPFPIIDSLTLLAAIAARTRKIKLGTGVLVLPLRNPVVLAKELSSLDLIAGGRLLLGMASGWYKREFDAVGVPFTSAAGSWTGISRSCAGCGPRTRSMANTRRMSCAVRTCRQNRRRCRPS